jgi:hypothetical protein
MLKNWISTYPKTATWIFKLIESELTNAPIVAKNFLQSIQKPLRMFVIFGPGYGDQVCVINILDRLLELGYQGSIDIVGAVFTLKKTMLLMNVDNKMDNNSIIETTLENGLHVRFIDYAYFKNHSQDFHKAELAIFAGLWNAIVYQYGNKQLTSLAHASRVLSFNPFSFVTSNSPAITYELEKKIVQYEYLSTVLPYRITLPTQEKIKQAIVRFSEQNPFAAKAVRQILRNKNSGKTNTFAIYGLDVSLHPKPQFNLINLIISAANARNISDKPLYVMALNTMPNESWQELKKFFELSYIGPKDIYTELQKLSKKTIFVDITANNTIPNISSIQDSKIIIFRMPSLPRVLFNTLFNSTLPPVYEGANSASFLQNLGRYGLPCPRSRFILPVDHPYLSAELIEASYYTCRDDFSMRKNLTPKEVLTPLMETYSNITGEMTPRYMMEPDRVAYGLAKISRQEDCTTKPSSCAFFQPAQHLSNVFALHGLTATKGFFYGVAEESSDIFFKRKLMMTDKRASLIRKTMRLSLQIAIEGPELFIFMFFVISILADYAFNATSTRNYVRELLNTLMLLIQFSFLVIDYDLGAMVLISSLIATALLAESFGHFMTQTLFGQKNTNTPHRNSVVEQAENENSRPTSHPSQVSRK